jgi:hypothetical protein
MSTALTDKLLYFLSLMPAPVPLAATRSFACRQESSDRRMQAQIHVFPVKGVRAVNLFIVRINRTHSHHFTSIYGLFNFSSTSSDYVTWNGRMIN